LQASALNITARFSNQTTHIQNLKETANWRHLLRT